MGALFWGMIFGAVGTGYFIYGKKQGEMWALGAGVALCLFPYFIDNLWLTLLVGAGLMALPFVAHRQGW